LASLSVDIILLVLFYSGVNTINQPWRRTAYQVITFAGIFVCGCGYTFGRKLWEQLVIIVQNDIQGALRTGRDLGAAGVLGVADAYPVNYPQAAPIRANAQPVVAATSVADENLPGAAPVTVPTSTTFDGANDPEMLEAVPVAAPPGMTLRAVEV